MRRAILLLIAAACLLTACTRSAATPPAASSSGASPTVAPPPASSEPAPPAPDGLTVVEGAQAAEANVTGQPVTADVPLYTPLPPTPPPVGPGSPDPWQNRQPVPRGQERDVLKQVADHLTASGAPGLPDAVPALYVGALEGGNYVYDLGRGGESPDRRIYLLKRDGAGWRATHICALWSRSVSLVQTNGQPLLRCGDTAGTYHLRRVGSLYSGETEVFRYAADELTLTEDPDTDRPRLVLTNSDLVHGLKGGFPVTSRFTYRWNGSAYAQTKYERQEDWGYHLAHFLDLLAANRLAEAAGDFAGGAPPGGVKAYLERNASVLVDGPHDLIYQQTAMVQGNLRAYLRVGDPAPGTWIFFAFTDDGHIRAVGLEAPPAS